MVVVDGDGVSVKGGGTASIAELANGEQRMGVEIGKEMGSGGGGRECWKVKGSCSCGVHGAAIWKVDTDRVAVGCVRKCRGLGKSEEVNGAASVGDGKMGEWEGGT